MMTYTFKPLVCNASKLTGCSTDPASARNVLLVKTRWVDEGSCCHIMPAS